MSIFVLGHGTYADGDFTFVPEGMTLKFYSDFDENLLFANSMLVLMSGGNYGSYNEYQPGDIVPNYMLTAQTYDEMALDMAGATESDVLWFVGGGSLRGERGLVSDRHLCEGGEGCGKPNGTEAHVDSFATEPHKCSPGNGALGLLQDNGGGEINFLICRSMQGRGSGAQDPSSQATTYLKSTALKSFNERAQEKNTEFRLLTQSDPEAALAYIERLGKSKEKADRDIQTLLLNDHDIYNWVATENARKFATEKGQFTFVRYYRKQPENLRKVFDQDPFLKQQVDYVNDYMETFTKLNHRQKSELWPRIAQNDQESMTEWNPSIKSWTQLKAVWGDIENQNRAALKKLTDKGEVSFTQLGSIVLVGDSHPADALTYLRGKPIKKGKISIRKARTMVPGAGTLYVTYEKPPRDQDKNNLEIALGQVSDKDVKYASQG